ncbi:hypothetical protein RJT34_03661 [Clitoria ternatea]|uniref:Cation/H+ exchanger domain-containing protein n=1 Tax=Clitoria ternatea TaxID=43366 RepID=A0AAN9KML5_CLITE
MFIYNGKLFNATETIFTQVNLTNNFTYNVCTWTPPIIVSDGIWGGHARAPMKSSLPLFELQILLIFAVTQICHFFLKIFNFPPFVSQLMAGLILGPTIQLETVDKYKQKLFPYGTQDTLATISSIGYGLFIFTSGVQMDLSMVTRTGRKAWAIAILGLALPLLICLPIINILFRGLDRDVTAIILAETVISFPVVASLLIELKIINSELGRLALSSVLVSDILSKTIECLSNVFLDDTVPMDQIFMLLMSLIAFGILVPLVSRPAMFWMIKRTPEGTPVDDGYVYVIIGMVFCLGWVAVQINQDFILGAFILGLAVPEGPPLGSALVKKLNFFGNCFLLPIFVTCSAMKVDFSLEHPSKTVIVISAITVAIHLIKTIACFIPALFCKMPKKDALALALILNAKGIVEVGTFSSLYDDGILSDQAYAEMIITIMIVACIVKWSVKLLYDPSRKYAGYQRRNIMSLKPDSELRILACVHKSYHIYAMTDVLDLCHPTIEHPIIVDALHLVELVGRISPIFISHRVHKTISAGSYKSCSDDVILALDLYEHDNFGAATAHTYTAISPPALMHEDLCNLAVDKVASIMILPFHLRWSSDGGIESDDKNVRSINCTVLEIAPCSVGILVSRSSYPSNKAIRLAMVFLGGQDDREALCLTKRAMRNIRVNLVVYHLAPKEQTPDMELLLDIQELEDVKKPKHGLDNVRYHKIIVNDGPETSTVLRDIVNEHDFFIVGRRHAPDSPQTEGLTNWSEFPELGVIGDLLASPDFESKAGVLVVQQQNT